MKPFALFTTLLVSLVGAQEIKHAPRIEQCRADQKLWMSKLEGDNGLKNVSFRELRGWNSVISDCENVDTELHDRYYRTASEITAAMALRLSDFIGRHSLWEKFDIEDEQGKGRNQ